MVLFAAATGLRPGEWIALEQRDIGLDNRLVHVRRAFRVNRLKTTKTDTPRAVPLQRSALDALDQPPSPPSATSLLFPPPKVATSTCTTGGRATGAPRSVPPASPRPAASTICATRSPPSRCAPDSAPSNCRATWAPASSTSTAATDTSPATATNTPWICSTTTTAAAATWTLVDVPWTSTPRSRRSPPQWKVASSRPFWESPLPDSNRRPLPYHSRCTSRETG
jgi:hypothetical protein